MLRTANMPIAVMSVVTITTITTVVPRSDLRDKRRFREATNWLFSKLRSGMSL